MNTYKKSRKKKYIPAAVISLLILAAVLYGIRNGGEDGRGGNILAGASPDTSVFQMYYFDGETVVVAPLVAVTQAAPDGEGHGDLLRHFQGDTLGQVGIVTVQFDGCHM